MDPEINLPPAPLCVADAVRQSYRANFDDAAPEVKLHPVTSNQEIIATHKVDGKGVLDWILQDATGQIVYIEPNSTGRLFGWRLQDLEANDASEMVHPADREVVRRLRDQARHTGETQRLQIRVRTKRGQWAWAEATFEAAQNCLGEPNTLTAASLRDVSATHVEDDALRLLVDLRSLIGGACTVTEAWHWGLSRVLEVSDFVSATVWSKGSADAKEPGTWRPLAKAACDTGATTPNDVEQAWGAEGPMWLAFDRKSHQGAAKTTYSLFINVESSNEDASAVVELHSNQRSTDSEDLVVAAITQIGDVIGQKETQVRLITAEREFREAFDNAGIGIALNRPDGSFERVNDAMCELLGRNRSDLMGLTFADVTHPDDRVVGTKSVRELLDGTRSRYISEKRYLQPTGKVVWGLLSLTLVRDEHNAPVHFIAQIQDITAQREAQAQLAHIASHDALTGLPNRSLVIDRIKAAQECSEISRRHIGLLFIDLDNFKSFNDSLGHHGGDTVLVDLAERLLAVVRSTDTVARLGGDEFVVLCDELSCTEPEALAELRSIADEIHEALRAPVRVDGIDVYCSASIGIDMIVGNSTTVHEALGNADSAMYQAKARGRARSEVYDAEARGAALERLKLVADLRLALERDELSVAYQPIVDLASCKILGAEALLRWHHPELGRIAPSKFISIAEENQLIVALGDYVLNHACEFLRDHPDPSFYVSVNLSAHQLRHSRFVETVKDLLHRFDITGSRLAFELTEHVLMDANAESLSQLNELRELGASLGVDDFGTGFASLTYLRQLPIKFLKVDQSFVSGLVEDPADRSITHAVISLAAALGIAVVAEGVETQAQADVLISLECACAQGYLFGRPTDRSAFL